MKRSEFVENINNFWDLVDFCNDHNLDACCYIFHHDDLDDRICEEICDMTRCCSWGEIRRFLNAIEGDYDWYNEEFEGIDDAFDDYKQDTLDEADDDEIWEPEDDEENDEEEQQEEADDNEVSEPQEEIPDIEISDEDFFALLAI